ncbi:response regulator [Ramlibacter rhizophilus]|uniref:Response regulator n=1 Tax=Ramlibacter rhizophilus TaxID=1781167 RepID=A0A4Z0BZ90_9BURK|nr:response regulator [Ramlibacter rhizophilus]TFZ03279.1 response regulator [Ramlibacter rhizophilus]
MSPMPTVLLVEDDEAIQRFLQASLEAEGYRVQVAAGVRQAEAMAAGRRIDVFLVDLGLPDGEGLDLIRRLREWTLRPVLVLSARAHEAQKVQALDAGADDYLVKPFGAAELHARLRVALRHAAQTTLQGSAVVCAAGGVRIDLQARSVSRAGAAVRLTATEWRLLEALARRADRVVTTSQLLRDVWGPGHLEQGHYLRIYIRQLRQKLEEAPTEPRILMTDIGVGYRLISAS